MILRKIQSQVNVGKNFENSRNDMTMKLGVLEKSLVSCLYWFNDSIFWKIYKFNTNSAFANSHIKEITNIEEKVHHRNDNGRQHEKNKDQILKHVLCCEIISFIFCFFVFLFLAFSQFRKKAHKKK